MNSLIKLFSDKKYQFYSEIKDNGESNIKGLYLLEDVAGKPLVKTGLNDGYDLGNLV